MTEHSNKDFQWTDELVKDFVRERIISPCDYLYTQLDDRVDSFKIEHTNTYTSKDNLVSGSNVALNEKKALFITEDGKEIFEGDRAWFVNKILSVDFYDFEDRGNRKEDLKHYQNEYKYFSTELAAHQYVSENKPQFSIKDFKDILIRYDYAIDMMEDVFSDLKYLGKLNDKNG